MDTTLCVGTAGQSVWFSDDRGESWERPLSECGLYLECRVGALVSHPTWVGRVLAGTDCGIYRGDLTNRTWQHITSPMDDRQIWSIAISPHDPDVIVVGTRPATIFCSRDGGATWEEASVDFPTECVFVDVPRVTQVLWDPELPERVWCSLEIGGIHRSDDSGRTFVKVDGGGLLSEDVHGLAVTNFGKRLLWATLNKGLHVSEDEGETFRVVELDAPAQYVRSIESLAGSDTLLLTNGNGPPGDSGRLHLSQQGGSWRVLELPGETNSTVWCIATHPADPSLVYCATNLGQVFRSTDGAVTWTRLAREFGEIRSLHWAVR